MLLRAVPLVATSLRAVSSPSLPAGHPHRRRAFDYARRAGDDHPAGVLSEAAGDRAAAEAIRAAAEAIRAARFDLGGGVAPANRPRHTSLSGVS